MAARICTALILLCVAGSLDPVAGQKPVITVSTAQSSIAENPNQVTRTTSTTSLSTTRTSSATFTVRSDRIVPSNLTIQYSVSGTALAGKDYQALPGSVTIPAGQASASITVVPINDSEDELDETVAISITATLRSPYSTTRPSTGRTTIMDDDDVRIVGLAMTPDTILGGSTRDLRVTVSGAAPPGGLLVSVRSGNATVVPDAQATIAAGTRVGIARLATSAVASTVAVPLTVTEPNGSSARDTLIVLTEPALSSVNFRFRDNFGGSDYVGSISLASAAPPGGFAVPVSLAVVSPSGAALPASAPSSIMMQGGGLSAGFRVATQLVRTHTKVEVRAGSGAGSVSRIIDIYPIPEVQSITVTPDPAPGKDSVDVTVRLTEPIGPRFGYAYDVNGSGPVEIAAGTRVNVPYGNQQATRRLATSAVSGPTPATLTVRARDLPSAWSTTFTVAPSMPLPSVAVVGFMSATQIGGAPADVMIVLTGPVPASKTLSLNLTATDPVLPPVSSTITIPAGQATASLTLQTREVTQVMQGSLRAEVPGGSGVTGTVTLQPRPLTLVSLTLNPTQLVVGNPVTGTIRLSDAAPAGGLVVSLGTSHSTVVSLPATITVPAGASSASFQAPTSSLTSQAEVRVTATLSTQQVQQTFWVLPVPAQLTALEFNSSVVPAGGAVTGRVELAAPANAPVAVTLSASPSSLVSMPALVTVPAGQSSVTFQLTAGQVTLLPVPVQVVATLGTAQVNATVNVQPGPPAVSSITAKPVSGFGGGEFAFTVSLDRTAPSSGQSVQLVSSNPSVIPNTTVQIPGGRQNASVFVRTNAVGSTGTVRLALQQNTAGAGILLQPLPIDRVQTPGSVSGGNSLDVSIHLTQPAPVGGLRVPLTSSNPSVVNVPAFVDIQAGATGASITVPVAAGVRDQEVTLTAGIGPGARSRTVRVRA